MAVHALLRDLFFRSRIEATAEAAGVPVIVSGTVEELLERMREAGGRAVGVGGRAHKGLPEPAELEACGSHVDVQAFDAALAAGADRVLPRSAFTRRLPEILRELAGS